MSNNELNVRAIDTLNDFRIALRKFSSSAQSILLSTDNEIQRTQEWLRKRELHWRHEVEKCRHEVKKARDALERCRRNARSDRNKRGRNSDCRGEAAALQRAKSALRQAQTNLDKVRSWQKRVKQAISQYRANRNRLKELCTSRTDYAHGFLHRKHAELEKYVSTSQRASVSTSAKIPSARKGKIFEDWAKENVFKGKRRRIRVPLELNDKHLCDIDPDEFGLSSSRISDNYVDEDGGLWDAKAYSESSRVNEDQLRDYQLMKEAGFVIDSNGNKIEVNSINYLFSNQSAAESNSYLASYYGVNVWYVDDVGRVRLLEGQ